MSGSDILEELEAVTGAMLAELDSESKPGMLLAVLEAMVGTRERSSGTPKHTRPTVD